MNTHLHGAHWLNPVNFSRRDFLKLSSLSTAALALGIMPGCENRAGVINLINYSPSEATGVELNPFIFIDTSGEVTLVSHRPDIGNGTSQAMLMLLAEELEVDLSKVIVIQAKANQSVYGDQYTASSNSVRGSYLPSRKIASTARQMLIQSAANKWSVSDTDCHASNGSVFHPGSNRSASYGDLVEEARQLTPPREPKLKTASEFKIIGKSLARRDIPDKTNGTAIFGMDSRIEGMLYASVERSPTFYGKVIAFNSKEVLAMPGVRYVEKTEMHDVMNIREGVAVVADSYWAALQGRKALRIQWDYEDTEAWDSNRIFNQYKEDSKLIGQNHSTKGNIENAKQRASRTFSAEYQCPMMVHAPLEPPNIVANVKDDHCFILGSMQDPVWVRQELSVLLDMPVGAVEVWLTVVGGGFGRKAYTDFANEAALLSKKINRPVKVIWSREDDISQGPFRPGSINVLHACCDDQDQITALSHKVISTDFYTALDYPVSALLDGILSHGYDFDNMSYDLVDSKVPIPFIWMRSVGSSGNGFAHECFIDELAHEVKTDPLDFRLNYLRNSPRFIGVLEELAIQSSWRDPTDFNEAKGMAILRLRDTIVGHVALLSRKESGSINLNRIIVVVDCGIVINPDIVKQQIEGGTVMGLSSSFKKEITIHKGKVNENNYDSYPIVRYSECPEIETHIISSTENPGGIGEVGMPGIAPAVLNAYFNLTGRRIRKLPFDLYSV